jgi:AAA family ATP:ADP antiporter
MIASDRYLMMIAALVVVLNIVNTSGEYLFGRYVVSAAEAAHGAGPQNEAARQSFIGSTYSSFFSYVNLFGFLMQMFVVSRVFKVLGVGKALFIHPIVALGGYLMMLQAPSFNAIRWLKIADNSLDYSLGNTTRQALWLPTSREAKYKAKQAVDSFCQRAGDVLQAGIVYASTLAGFGVTAFAALNIIFVAGWLAVSAGLNHRLRAQAQQAGKAQL